MFDWVLNKALEIMRLSRFKHKWSITKTTVGFTFSKEMAKEEEKSSQDF